MKTQLNNQNNTLYDMTHANDVIREYNGTCPTLQHRMGTGGGQVPIRIEMSNNKSRKYIVRRLTPLECCRLQGFPDWWCDGLIQESPSEEEIIFWQNIFDTYSSIFSKKCKTKNQIIKWLKSEPTDSAIYKMWGNGIALPCAVDVISGIVDYLENENQNDSK